jgi:asparagine synthase (glutamine-hydrolysing)
MCGITGYFGQGNKEILEKMTNSLIHRGPDDQGFYIHDNLGLGHRRLSIIDLETGHQPITNEDKTVWLIFNGEIYNFKKLKERLIDQGHKFATRSDTETIVHSYEEEGMDFLSGLNGMFALALWDEKEKKLVLARDRLGQKPLYYSLIGQTLIFGSELKALLDHPVVKKELDLRSLAKYLIYEYVPAPHSIFKNIYKLGPGEYLVYQNNKLEIRKYWDIEFNLEPTTQNSKPQPKTQNLSYYLGELERKFEEAVKIRLMSDVPLGVFLSGGIDSTSIAYYAQKNSSEKIKTFSIGFTDKSFDESKYARQAAKFLRSDHYEKILEPKDCLDLIPQVNSFLDEPLADASIIPTYLLSKFTREKVTVALSGDGGDELLMGYPTFQAHQLGRFYQYLPDFLKKGIISPLVNRLPASLNNISFDFKLKKFISGYDYPPEIRNQIWLGSFTPADFEKIFSPQVYQMIKSANHFDDIENYLELIKKEPLENRLIYLYLKNYLQDDILVKTDRASMANSLEARAPFLDYNLVEFVNSLPSQYKLRGWQTKYIFKKLLKDKIPKNIVYRPKKGFGMPVAKWIRNELKDFTLSLFEEKKIKEQGIFNYSYLNQLLKEHFSGRRDNRKLLWTLMIFQMWQERWF